MSRQINPSPRNTLPLGLLDCSELQPDLHNIASAFCADRVPMAAVRKAMEADGAYDAELWQEMVQMGWGGIAIAEAHGGSGLGMRELVSVAEPMGRHLVATPFTGNAIAAQWLTLAGTSQQQATWLPRLAAGEIAAIAATEASGDWRIDMPASHATRQGDGWQLTGTKHLVEWGAAAALLLVTCQVAGEFHVALVECSALPEGAIRAETIIDETRQSACITLDGVTIPDTAMLSAAACKAALPQIEAAMLTLQSAQMIGGADGALAVAQDYLSNRKQFGKLIGEYQALKHPLVDGYVAWESARSLMLAAASSIDAADPGALNAARMAKAAACDAYAFLADRAIQFHGGFGFTRACDAGLYRRNAIWLASQGGDAAWQRKQLAISLFSHASQPEGTNS